MATKLEGAKNLYSEDFAAWSSEQATLLRALRFGELDLAHLAEEVEDLGHSERDAVRRQVRRILEHLLKLEHSPVSEPRDGWKDTLTDARSILEDKLSPSLQSDLETMLPRLYAQILYAGRCGVSVSSRRRGRCRRTAPIRSTKSAGRSGCPRTATGSPTRPIEAPSPVCQAVAG